MDEFKPKLTNRQQSGEERTTNADPEEAVPTLKLSEDLSLAWRGEKAVVASKWGWPDDDVVGIVSQWIAENSHHPRNWAAKDWLENYEERLEERRKAQKRAEWDREEERTRERQERMKRYLNFNAPLLQSGLAKVGEETVPAELERNRHFGISGQKHPSVEDWEGYYGPPAITHESRSEEFTPMANQRSFDHTTQNVPPSERNTLKSREQCLKEADNLSRAHPYFRWSHQEALAGWRRYGNCCVYCGKNLMANWETLLSSAHTDHLLPRKYAELLWDDLNLVLACGVCNSLKRHYDANSDPELPASLRYQGGSLSEEQHTALLRLCRTEVIRRRKEAQRNMEAAISQWRALENVASGIAPLGFVGNTLHLDTLLSGSVAWNLARKHRPETKPDLRGAVLQRADLRQFDLQEVDFTGSDLSGANFTLNFQLKRANFTRALLCRCILHHGWMDGATAHLTNFCEADLSNARLSHCDFSGSDFTGAIFAGAELSGTILIGCDLRKADLSTASGLTSAQIESAITNESTKPPLYLQF
jgi:uncharacterized protein YjbI with pentapeptide repeats/5-methylcytosine-specific restriction endonuclease McrA